MTGQDIVLDMQPLDDYIRHKLLKPGAIYLDRLALLLLIFLQEFLSK